ncbi:MAG: uroporphyrinogen decarboxylase family protein [bacterium]
MTSRERVKKALNFEEPDRVPIDLGGTIMSGIMAHALDRLRKHLGLERRPVKVYEVFQMLGEVEMDVVDRLGIDVLPVEPLVQFFGLRRKNYKPWKLCDGTDVLVPGQFEVETNSEGNYLIHNEGDINKPVEGRMPKDGYYFDMSSMTETHLDFKPPSLDEIKKENHISGKELEFLQERAEKLRKETDKALLLGCWGKVGLPTVGSIPDFLCLMATDRTYVKDMFAIRTETAIKNMELLKEYLGDNIDILGLDGYDYGSQKAELFSPQWFEELFVPYFREQNDWVHSNTNWKTWQHTCGSITKILPMLVKTHLDIINPVQCSAEGMDPQWLKDTFRGKLVFWGGSVDTQKTLPFGTTEDVKNEVIERLRIFAPGGGYVFNPVHNIQHGTPPENIVTAYDTAKEYSKDVLQS